MPRIIGSNDKRIPLNANLLAINNQTIEDFLEFEFYNDLSKGREVLIEKNGISKRVLFRPQERISIKLEPPVYRHCENDCDFCFIKGLPSGLRKEVYFRDDDYRLSFLFGNFLSLTNLTKEDIKRIGRLKLSPLYVSVHTTLADLRKRLFKNDKAGLILEQVSALVEQDIKIHCQVVVIPKMTDGKSLLQTIYDLSKLYPGVNSVGIVPVGRSRYLKNVPLISQKLSREIVKTVEKIHQVFRKRYQKGFVYLADEFYLKAQQPLPPRKFYDDFPQYENGIGMAREFMDEIKALKGQKKIKGKFLLLTGKMALPLLKMLQQRLGELHSDCNIDVLPVENSLFGSSITVAGLIGANDFSKKIRMLDKRYDKIILPANCVNHEGRFIDNGKLGDRRIVVAPSLQELWKWLQ